MKRLFTLPLLSAMTMGFISMAQTTSWVNFASTMEGDPTLSLEATSKVRLYFQPELIIYEDNQGNYNISYDDATRIFFTDTQLKVTDITTITNQTSRLVYESANRLLKVESGETADEIKVYSVTGNLLRFGYNLDHLSLEGLPYTVLIVQGRFANHIVTNKISL